MAGEAMAKCGVCNKNRVLSRFSQQALRKYNESLRSTRNLGNKASVKYPTCMLCSAGNVTELKCIGCEMTKSLDEFAKRQRSNPDNARCIDCQQEHNDRLPDLQEELAEEIIKRRLEASSSAASNISSAVSLASGMSRMTMSSTTSNPSTVGHSTYAGSESAVWIPPRSGIHGTSKISHDGKVEQDSFSVAGLDDTASTTSHGSYAHSHTTQKTSNAASHSGRNFAKINAYKEDPHTRAQRQFAREEKRKKESQMQEERVADSDGSDSSFEL